MKAICIFVIFDRASLVGAFLQTALSLINSLFNWLSHPIPEKTLIHLHAKNLRASYLKLLQNVHFLKDILDLVQFQITLLVQELLQ